MTKRDRILYDPAPTAGLLWNPITKKMKASSSERQVLEI